MLNRASRFFPILRALRSVLTTGGVILEVGSGSLGLGEYWHGKFVGCDVAFAARPAKNMRAVCCSGQHLPFRDRSFDAVVVSDVMEHVPPLQRTHIAGEALRVARKLVVIGYPCGPAAFDLDQKLLREYKTRHLAPPQWLEEHMLHPFPDEKLLVELPEGWKRNVIPNESLQFHDWMMRAEISLLANYSFRVALRVAPAAVERLLQRADQEPSYRKIFILSRETEEQYA